MFEGGAGLGRSSFHGRSQRHPAFVVQPCPVVAETDADGTRVTGRERPGRGRPRLAGRRNDAIPVRCVHVGNVGIVVGLRTMSCQRDTRTHTQHLVAVFRMFYKLYLLPITQPTMSKH